MNRNYHLKRYVWIVTGVVGLGALGWMLQPQPMIVEAARATRGTLVATVRGEGKAQVRDLYIVATPVDGELERIDVRPGDLVTPDKVIARIRPIASRPLDPRSRSEATATTVVAQAAIARADAAQREATVALEHADSELREAQKLAHDGAIPASQAMHAGHQAEIRRQALDEAAAVARQARAELARAAAVLSPRVVGGEPLGVTSPAPGQVLRILRESEGPVSAGTRLIEMGDVSRLEIVADLLSSDAARVRPGAAATLTGWGGNQPITARVRRIDPAAFTKVSALGLEEQRVHVVLDLAEPTPAGLGHDYRVDVTIAVWEGNDVLRVPSTGLFRSRDDRWAVFAVHDGRARLIPIDVGPSDGTWTVVEKGLSDGEMVIVQPGDQIGDGTRVRW